MPFISQVSLHGFRSINHTQHVLLDDLNVLIGPPGSGKTTFIDAIRLYVQTLTDPDHTLEPMYDPNLPEAYDAAISVFSPSNDAPNIVTFRKNPANGHLTAAAVSLPNQIDPAELGAVASYDFTTLGHLPFPNQDDIDHDVLAPDGANLPAFIQQLRESDPNRVTKIASIAARSNPETPKLLATPDTDYSSISPGTLKAIALTTLFNLPYHSRPPFMTIETPESDQPPAFMPVLLSMAVAHHGPQLIFTTQNLSFINSCQPEHIIGVSHDGYGTSYQQPDSRYLHHRIRGGEQMADLWQGGRLNEVERRLAFIYRKTA